jgi:uncharacterized membrane protein
VLVGHAENVDFGRAGKLTGAEMGSSIALMMGRLQQLWLLGQGEAGKEGDMGQAILWSLVLLGVVIGMFLVVMWIKRRMSSVEVSSVPAGGFTISDLRAMHKAGQISTEEFEKAKVKIVEAAKRASERMEQEKRKRELGDAE